MKLLKKRETEMNSLDINYIVRIDIISPLK